LVRFGEIWSNEGKIEAKYGQGWLNSGKIDWIWAGLVWAGSVWAGSVFTSSKTFDLLRLCSSYNAEACNEFAYKEAFKNS